MTIALSARVLSFGASVEACRHFLSIRLGHWEVFAEREAVRSPFKVSREMPGAVIVDMPGLSLSFVNHRAVVSQ
ncbi:hypothetical protein EBL89_15785 [Cereibacter sphaeroides]|uniref:hypothetical protein n=1 Tax=Cereibacter sphaeroides TaxID=1063 RepID=UPI000F525BA1|nr:hypothetical protein [Cereibacter sphaeroides]AZB56685.1 hypothetical protein EBL89_15785 [Cereibacter sphaeroides]AZB60959.1 hypothetical protein EBL88_15755 [Cereibacter sphaeroides]